MRGIKIFMLLVPVMIGLVACQKSPETSMDLASADEVLESEGVTTESIFVHVCGAVQNEGVYELSVGSRVYEAIEKAGGFASDAATAEVNQAQLLQDAAKLYVPTVAEVQEMNSQETGKVNINQASAEELMTLPGIGESKAESIIRYRESSGSFQKVEDIMQIPGIKEALFEKIKDLIQI